MALVLPNAGRERAGLKHANWEVETVSGSSMNTESLGRFVGSLKSTRDVVRDRDAFLARSAAKMQGPSVAGMPLVGLGGSCGKPAFLLPFVVRFDQRNLAQLEAVAAKRGMFIEYGAYPHLKLEEDGREIAAVQDWTQSTLVFMRPSYPHMDELMLEICSALAPAEANAADPTT